MPSPVMSLEQFAEGLFPLRGLDLSTEVAEQREGTTRTGINVRTQEPQTLRNRGGARPGMVKYIADQVNGDNKIQLLDIIVDPTTDALLAEDLIGDIPDPSTNNRSQRQPASGLRRIRRRGSGAWFSRNTPKTTLTITADDQTKQFGDVFTFTGDECVVTGLQIGDSVDSVTLTSPGAPAAATVEGSPYPISVGAVSGTSLTSTSFAKKYKIKRVQGSLTVSKTNSQFIQGTQANYVAPNVSKTLAFASNVTAGNLLLVAVAVAENGAGSAVVTVTDSRGNTYSQVSGYQVFNTPAGNQLSLWYAVANGTGACTVTAAQGLDPTFAGVAKIGVLEYGGIAASPLDGSGGNANNSFVTPFTTGTIPAAGPGRTFIGVFWHIGANGVTPAAGYTLRLGAGGGDVLKSVDSFLVAGSQAITVTPIVSGEYAGIGGSFKAT